MNTNSKVNGAATVNSTPLFKYAEDNRKALYKVAFSKYGKVGYNYFDDFDDVRNYINCMHEQNPGFEFGLLFFKKGKSWEFDFDFTYNFHHNPETVTSQPEPEEAVKQSYTGWYNSDALEEIYFTKREAEEALVYAFGGACGDCGFNSKAEILATYPVKKGTFKYPISTDKINYLSHNHLVKNEEPKSPESENK